MTRHIVLLPGDGIGPEIIEPAVAVLDAVAPGEFEYEEHLFGGASIDEHGIALTDDVLERCRAADAVLLAAVGGPKWDTTDHAAARPAQRTRAVREPSSGQTAAGALRRLAAPARDHRGNRPARRARADRRDL